MEDFSTTRLDILSFAGDASGGAQKVVELNMYTLGIKCN